MRVALVNNYAPFAYGGAEFLVDTLKDELLKRGHEVALSRIPFPVTLDHQLLANIVTCRNLPYDEADKVIAFKFPAFYVKHPDKTLWIFHQFRQVYELWNGEYGLSDTPANAMMREVITGSDQRFLPEAKKIFVNSKEVAGRLKRFNGIDSEVLYPPLLDREKCHLREYGDFLFYPSRVTTFKRQHLAIESMRYTRSKVRLAIAGKSDEPQYDAQLRKLIADHDLGEKVALLGWIEQPKKFELMADALACLYLAYQEDSYGFVSMEAFYSKKGVIALTDSGGTRELIEDGVNGFVLPPEPQALAAKFDELYENRALARRLGESGYEELTSRNIDWDTIIARLLA